jgi:carboxylesterase
MFASHPDPARSYSEAAERIAAIQARDGPEVEAGSGTAWLDHGQRVERAIVLLHGYTNSPKMYSALGKIFFELGYNVFIPREPHHGLRDRMTPLHADLTAAGLARFAEQAVDIGLGLGERVTLFGISMGGALTAWAAQNRADIHLAAMASPAIGFRSIPRRLVPLAAWLGRRLPNRFIWWDSKIKDTPHPPYHTYPRYATRSLANILTLSQSVLGQARRSPPCALETLVMINPSDRSVDNVLTGQLIDAWRAAGANNLRTYTFEARYELAHDLIDPEQPGGQVGVVYPILVEQLRRWEIGD